MPNAVRLGAGIGAAIAMLLFAWMVAGGRWSGLFEPGPATSRIYDAQARSLLDGRIDVPPELTGVEGFTTENGSQVYFGIAPAIARLPIVALTDRLDGQLTQSSLLLGAMVSLWATARMAWMARTALLPHVPVGRADVLLMGWFIASVGVASPLLTLAVRPAIYLESSVWGVALTLSALVQVLTLWSAFSLRRTAVATALAAGALNSRASVGVVAVVALGLVLVHARPKGRGLLLAMSLALAPVAAYGAVNQARFGSPASVPWADQVYTESSTSRRAALESTNGRLLGLAYVPTNALVYLRPDATRATSLFPFVRLPQLQVIGDVTMDIVEPSPSVPSLAPALSVLGVAGAARLLRRRGRPPGWAPVLAATSLGILGVLTIASVAVRYTADFLPMLVTSASLGLWWLRDWLSRAGPWVRRVGGATLGVLTLAGAVTAGAATLSSQRLTFFASHRTIASFVALQYDVQQRWFGGSPPQVTVRADLPAPDAGEFADVVVLTGCRGVYWLSDDGWTYVERGPGRRFHLKGAISSTPRVLVTGGGWTLQLRRDRDGRVLVETGPRTDLRVAAITDLPRSRLELDVVVDPVGGVIQVEHEGERAVDLFGYALPDDLRPGRGWESRAPATPTCDLLTEAALRE